MRKPESMEELIYFTNRDLGDKGSARVWVFKEKCPECGKGLMGKPVDPKTGKVRIRAKEYVCPECGYSEEKVSHEEKLTACAEYTCPECGHEDEAEIPFRRRRIKGTLTLRFQCSSCGANIDITKKMKDKDA